MPDGKFITGRDFGVTPVSIRGYNTDSFAMEMLGNFDVGYDLFNGSQRKSALKLTGYFIETGRKIIFHNEHSYKKWQLELSEKSIKELAEKGFINNSKIHVLINF